MSRFRPLKRSRIHTTAHLPVGHPSTYVTGKTALKRAQAARVEVANEPTTAGALHVCLFVHPLKKEGNAPAGYLGCVCGRWGVGSEPPKEHE